jgi:hypothetical protein
MATPSVPGSSRWGLIVAVTLGAGGLFCFYWAVSVAQVNFVPCNNTFTWGAPLFQCRLPVYLETLGFLCLGAGLLVALRTLFLWRRRPRVIPSAAASPP